MIKLKDIYLLLLEETKEEMNDMIDQIERQLKKKEALLKIEKKYDGNENKIELLKQQIENLEDRLDKKEELLDQLKDTTE